MLLAGLTRPHGAVRISSSPHPARTASSPPRQWPTGSKRFGQATSSTVGLSDREREKLYSAGTRWMQRVGRRSKSFHVAPFEGKKNAKKKKKRTKKIPRETSVERKHQKPAFQRSRVGRGTLQPRKHGRATGQEPPFLSPPSSPPATSGLLLLWQ